VIERLGFVFIVDVEYECLLTFRSYCKIIDHMLFACRPFSQSERTNQ